MRRWRVRSLVSVVVVLGATLTMAPAQAGPCDPPFNEIVCENSKSGSPASEWDISGSGDSSIQGFATSMSVNQGQGVQFKIDTDADDYRLDIYRMGYYGGDGARKITTVEPSASLPQDQPDCLEEGSTGLVDCGNWGVSATWTVPSSAVSGIYFAKLVRESGHEGASHVFFVVRDDDGASELLFQTSDTTWQAYNEYGGNSLYKGQPAGRAYKVSYNRPFVTRQETNGPRQSWVFNAEYPMVRWIERNGYDVSYSSGIDTDRLGSELMEHETFLSVGHDEYWSGQQRSNVEAARNAGVNLAFFSANEVFWKTRWEPSIDGSNTQHRTLVCYKETAAGEKIDPSPAWTGTWRDPRFSPPSDGGHPENALTGTLFTVNGPRSDSIEVPGGYAGLRFWRNTSVASLAPGQKATFPAGTLGYEWDEDVDNGHRPPGLFGMSSTTTQVHQHLIDHGNTYVPGQATHHLSLYRHASGALVFGAGTVQWSWGLDAEHDFAGTSTDARMQQATVNLFADMGAQPQTLQAGLTPAAASTDNTDPAAAIADPSTPVGMGSDVTVAGTADDVGGVVAGVEVSDDNGATWHPASGRSTWTYRWTAPEEAGTVNLLARAIDDSGNIGSSTVKTVTVGSGPVNCPCSLWSPSTVPSVIASGDAQAVEVGVKFRATTDGYITGLRFYKSSANTGTHTGQLFRGDGTLLKSATFSNETASGWQQVTFDAPVAITTGTTYVAAYHAPNGNYSKDENYFATSGVNSGPLRGLAAGVDGANGVYRYGSPGTMPTSSFQSSNYWVDVVFDTTPPPDTAPPIVTATAPGGDAVDVATDANVGAIFDEQISPASLNFTVIKSDGTSVPGTISYDSNTRTAMLDPQGPLSPGTRYRAAVSAADAAGNAMAQAYQWDFTAAGTAPCPCSLFTGLDVPAGNADGEVEPVELGVKFRSTTNGSITGLRFYKAPGNTGTHVGHLFKSDGTLLKSATFTNETASGWQQVSFDSPVDIAADTTYIASYHAPSGNFSKDEDYFATSGVNSGPLRGLAAGVDGANGVFRYGAPGTMPTSSYKSSNYWVDVVLDNGPPPDTAPPTVSAQTPAPGSTNLAVSGNATATFDEQIAPGSLKFTLTTQGGAAVPGSTTYDGATQTATFDPTADLLTGSVYVASVSAADPAGNAMVQPVTWSFTTTGPPQCPCSIFKPTDVPGGTAPDDAQAVELGVKFRSTTDGWITGLRFYKAPGNTGVHIGHLFRTNGTMLKSATFTNETASGWQQVTFDEPVAVTANTTYIAAYHAPNGNYSKDQGFFATSGVTSGRLTALASGVDGGNGVYRYGTAGKFPTASYQGTNYWVDVVLSTTPPPDIAPPAVTATSPTQNAVNIPIDASMSATFDEQIAAGSINFTLTGSDGTNVPGTTSYNPTSRTAAFDPQGSLAPGTRYRAAVSAADAAGNPMASAHQWYFTAAGSAPCPCSLFSALDTPGASSDDTSAVELGVKFRSTTDGFITGLRFHKAPGNTGTHIGHLFKSDGSLLKSATFTNETALGWQQVTFDAPVAVTAGTTYVASYHAPNGNYSKNENYFATSGVNSGPLGALATGVDGGNGVYRYGAAGGFPTSSYRASNYWVDVVFSSSP